MAGAGGFEPHRRSLTGLAYQMLGSFSDAQDVVQEAYLRWRQANGITHPGAWLRQVTTRLCLDQLKSARARREIYVGPWLPEPVLEEAGAWTDPTQDGALDLSVGLMLALERLSPLERAAFLLHDIFEMDFTAIGEAIGRSPQACRQLASRARAHVRSGRPRFVVPVEEGDRIVEAFRRAAETGDTKALAALLAEDTVLISDGGGKASAALNPVHGAAKVARFVVGVERKWPRSVLGRPVRINGAPGFVSVDTDGTLQATALDLRSDGRIQAIHIVRNPDKLRWVAARLDAGS